MIHPHWLKDAIFYQIFPDRFCRSLQSHPGFACKPWGADPAEQGYQGGDLFGVAQKLDYLADFGINALYLNPIFSSASNHRYHTYDYYQVDPLLGGNEALNQLIQAAHDRNMRIVLDGVFNHASRGFWQFHHILENGPESPYVDWFYIKDWPLNPYPKDKSEPHNYSGWWNLPALPKFNISHPDVREYLMQVGEHWIRQGIDGWRLDVADEIDDDSFWQEFRVRIKAINPNAYIVGEVWQHAEHWLQGDMFDATMNYPLTGALLSWFGGAETDISLNKNGLYLDQNSSADFARRIKAFQKTSDADIQFAQLNIMDSHDMGRALSILGGNIDKLKQALACLYLMPGAPCIYYGTEIAMAGRDDPDCRQAMPWSDNDTYPNDLRPYLRQLAELRAQYQIFGNSLVQVAVVSEHVIRIDLLDQIKRVQAVAWFNRGKKPFYLDTGAFVSFQLLLHLGADTASHELAASSMKLLVRTDIQTDKTGYPGFTFQAE